MSARAAGNPTIRVEDAPADRIGEYTVLRRVGSGGMATVWQVKGPGGALHALKEMRPQAEARREMTRRFKQEFEVTSRLDHRNIVGVHDFFAAQDTLHIVMEWVDGLDLRATLRYAGRLDPGRLALIGAEVASGIASAHAVGVLHRDLKPENILLSRRGEVKVADFGVARILGTRLTATGVILGSPAYMSPEQLAGVSSQKLDAATDVYGLGVLLYEMAEGRDPLGLKRHEDLLAVLKAKREKRPRPMRKLDHPDLAELILKTLEADPAERPESMDDLARRFRRIARKEGAVRADMEYLARVALDNRDNDRKAKGEPAPLRPAKPRRSSRAARRSQGTAETRRQPEATAGSRENPRRGARLREAASAVAERAGRSRGKPRAPGRDAPAPSRTPEPSDDRTSSTTRYASQIDDLSLKTGSARGVGATALAWLALLLFALAVLFLGASASLTESPLGLLELLVPLP